MQRYAIDVEHVGGASLVPTTFLQDAEDVGFLDVFERLDS
jgi:hypothetical protein